MLSLNNRVEEIHSKGFDMSTPRSIQSENAVIPEMDYAKLKIGVKALDDAVVALGAYKKLNPRMSKENI